MAEEEGVGAGGGGGADDDGIVVSGSSRRGMRDATDEEEKFRKTKRVRHSRKRADREPGGEGGEGMQAEEEEDEEVEERILAARMDHRMRRRTKGLVATTEILEGPDEESKNDLGIGYEFQEQSTTTELDKARQAFVDEQIERIRRGEQPVMPSEQRQAAAAAPVGDGKFVSGGFHVPEVPAGNSKWVGTTKTVPEIEQSATDLQKQFEYTKQVMEERRRQDQAKAASETDSRQRGPIYNYNALAFSRQRPNLNPPNLKK